MTSIYFSRGSTSTKLILWVEAMALATAATMPAKAYMFRTIVASGSSAAAVIEGRFPRQRRRPHWFDGGSGQIRVGA